MYENIELTVEQIRELFSSSGNGKEIIEALGLKDCGASRKFIRILAEKASIEYDEWLSKFKRSTPYYSKHPQYCKQCGKKLPFKQRDNKFCSHSCAAQFNNLGRVLTEETRWRISKGLQKKSDLFDGDFKPIKKIRGNCLNCGKTIERGNYCSIKCHHEYQYKLSVDRWLKGENPQRVGGLIPSFIKRYLMESHKCKCEKCGWCEKHPVSNTVPLEIHHIDGDCTNNRFKNLQLLCPNCHSLTDNFGGRNKKGRGFHRKKLGKE